MFKSAPSVLIPVGGPPAELLCVLDPIVRRWMAQNVNSRHLPLAFVMEQMVVTPNHLAVAMAQPSHHHLLGDAAVGGNRAEVMPQRVQPAVLKARLPVMRREFDCQRRQDFSLKYVPNSIWLEFSSLGTMEDATIGMMQQFSEHLLQVLMYG